MSRGVLDAGVAIAWLQRRPRSLARIDALLRECRAGRQPLHLSIVNLAEVLRHTAELARATGLDPLSALRATGVAVHTPDEAIAYRVARLGTISMADGFAVATALELGARLHTTDHALVRQIRRTRMATTLY